MYKVLIVEDDMIFAKDLASVLMKKGCKISGIAGNAKDAIHLFDTNNPDLLFIDIELKGKETGIDVANYIMKKARVPFIYLTDFYGQKNAQYFTKANDTRPYNFLPKGTFMDGTLWHFVELAMDNFGRENNLLPEGYETSYVLHGFMYVKTATSNTYTRIAINTMTHIEAGRPLSCIYTEKKIYKLKKSLTNLLAFLQTPYLVQVNQSIAVNLHNVVNFIPSDDIIIMEDGSQYPLGRKYKKAFLKVLPLAK